mgnify:CR=1 FL=1
MTRPGRLFIDAALAAGAGLTAAWAAIPTARPWLGIPALALALWLALRWQSRGSAVVLGAWAVVWFWCVLGWLQVVGSDARLATAIVCSLPLVLVGALAPQLARWPVGAVWIALAWTTQEWLRDRFPWGGFPWAGADFLSSTTWDAPWRVAGPPLAGFLVVLAAATLAVMAQQRTVRSLWIGPMALGATVLLMVLLGQTSTINQPTKAAPLRVALIQGGVPGTGLDFQDRAQGVLKRHIAQTDRLLAEVRRGRAPATDLIVWPENSTDLDPRRDAFASTQIAAVVKRAGVPILFGGVLDSDRANQVLNAAVLWAPGRAPEVVYVKQRPVPFGEFVPLRSSLGGLISRLNRIPADFQSGTTPGVVTLKGTRLGLVICFEIAHDDVVMATAARNIDALIVLTNNATFQGTGQSAQQFEVSRRRALQISRPVLTAATTGITAWVDRQATVKRQLPQVEPGFVSAEIVPVTPGASSAVRWGRSLNAVLALLGAGAMLTAAIMELRHRRRFPKDSL